MIKGDSLPPVSSPTYKSKSAIRLAFLCGGDPLDVRTWSGTPKHMLQALHEQFENIYVIRDPWPAWFILARRVLRMLSVGRIDIYWSARISRFAAASTIRRVQASGSDVACAVAITPITAVLSQCMPTVHVSDATHTAMFGYNPSHTVLLSPLSRSASQMETECITHSLFSTFPSEWAYASAIRDHHGDQKRTIQIHWGANMVASVATPPELRRADTWRLVFVGVDWEGKGGNIALEAFNMLRARGRDVRLDIVGCAPSHPPPRIDGVTFHGFLRKDIDSERAKLEALFRASHVLIFPTNFDALGVVVMEAASFGLPTIAYRTGGVPSNIDHDQTGLLLEPQSPGCDFANEIERLLSDWPRYLAFSHAALAISRERLNWSKWAMRIREEVDARMTSGHTSNSLADRVE